MDPEPGYAVKEVFFTQKSGPSGTTLYAITPGWPGRELVLNDVVTAPDSKVTLLATGEQLAWRQHDGALVVSLPDYQPDQHDEAQSYAYAFSISGVRSTR